MLSEIFKKYNIEAIQITDKGQLEYITIVSYHRTWYARSVGCVARNEGREMIREFRKFSGRRSRLVRDPLPQWKPVQRPERGQTTLARLF